MSKHISIHTPENHTAYYVNLEKYEELDDIDKFVYPIPKEDINSYYLYDIVDKKMISKSSDLKELRINPNVEILCFAGVSPKNVERFIHPDNVNYLIFEGGNLMSLEMAKTQKGAMLWAKVTNLYNEYKFIETLDERILLEEELRVIFNIELPKQIYDFGLGKLFKKIKTSNIENLTIRWAYFTDIDFQILSKLIQLKNLEIRYCYNDNIKWLPKNLTILKIFGNTIQSLSEINLDLPNIRQLDLGGNSINNLDTLSVLSENIYFFVLDNNLIKTFNVSELPKGLGYLDLSRNLIENDFFNQKSHHKAIRELFLSNNKLVISASILKRILEIFPNLDYLELLGNKTDGVPHEFLGDEENKNCIKLVQSFLEGVDFQHKGGELNIPKLSKYEHFVETIWTESSLPINVILADIQNTFSKHLLLVPTFRQYSNGFQCFIEHSICELFLITDQKLNRVFFKVYGDRSETVALYFHKYLKEINKIIFSKSHKNVLPSINSSESCEILKDFHLRAFKIDNRIKAHNILKPVDYSIKLLINNIDKEIEYENGKFAGIVYEDISNISFVLISGKSAYPFVVKDGVVTNCLKENQKYYYYLTLRSSIDKSNYIKGITNKYLNDFRLVEADLFIFNDVRTKVTCFVNTKYFHVNNGVLSLIDPNLTLNEKYFNEVKMDNMKWCEFNIENNFIGLKYVD